MRIRGRTMREGTHCNGQLTVGGGARGEGDGHWSRLLPRKDKVPLGLLGYLSRWGSRRESTASVSTPLDSIRRGMRAQRSLSDGGTKRDILPGIERQVHGQVEAADIKPEVGWGS